MKTKTIRKIGAMVMALVCVACASAPVMAASSADPSNNTATVNDLANSDIIDYSKTGSLSIYKYDTTSAEQDGVLTRDGAGSVVSIQGVGDVASTGEQNAEAEAALSDYAIQGVEFTIARLGKIETYSNTDKTHSDVKVVYEIPKTLADILELTEDDAVDMTGTTLANTCTDATKLHFESDTLDQALQTILDEDNKGAKDALEGWIETEAEKIVMKQTDKFGHTTVDNLELGLYLCVETKVPEEVVSTVNPWFASVPFTDADGEEWLYDMTCYPKNQTGNPTFDKQVRNAHGEKASVAGQYEDNSKLVSNLIEDGKEAEDEFIKNRTEYTYADTVTASEGDLLDYILVSRLPHITSEATYLTTYTFRDVLGAGITYNQDVHIAFYADAADAKVNNTAKALEIWDLTDGDKYGFAYADVYEIAGGATPNGDTALTVQMTQDGLNVINTKYSDQYMVVYYTGTVNSDNTAILGDAGNVNDAQLEWRRTSEAFYNTLEARCYVYTFGIDLTKVFSDGKGDPTKVTFALYNETDGYYVVADQVEEVEGQKIYYVTGKTTDQEAATKFSPNAAGSLVVKGIEGDQYQMTELTTDKGYALLKEQIVVDITTATRTIDPSVAGYVGNDDGTHRHTDECYDTVYGYVDQQGHFVPALVNGDGAYGYVNEFGEWVPATTYERHLICGQEEAATANGRTIGKVTMFVDDVVPSSATVDGVDATMTNGDGSVKMTVQNNRSFILPQTGGAGLYVATVAGVLACAGGFYLASRKKKEA